MATNRYISTTFWTDSWIQSLDPSEKFMYLYFLTNPLTNIAGVYEISMRQMCFDTGYNDNTIKCILEKFTKAGKVYYINDYIILKSWCKHQKWEESEKIRDGIKHIIEKLPAFVQQTLININFEFDLSFLKPKTVVKNESAFSPENEKVENNNSTEKTEVFCEKKENPQAKDTLSIPYPYPIDTPSIPYPYPSNYLNSNLNLNSNSSSNSKINIKNKIYNFLEENFGKDIVFSPDTVDKITSLCNKNQLSEEEAEAFLTYTLNYAREKVRDISSLPGYFYTVCGDFKMIQKFNANREKERESKEKASNLKKALVTVCPVCGTEHDRNEDCPVCRLSATSLNDVEEIQEVKKLYSLPEPARTEYYKRLDLFQEEMMKESLENKDFLALIKKRNSGITALRKEFLNIKEVI